MKNVNNKTLLVIIAVLLLSNLVLLGKLFRGGPEKGRVKQQGERTPVEFMSRELAFDESQKAQFKTLWEVTREKNRPLYDTIRLSRETLYKSLQQASQPLAEIDSLTSQIGRLEKQVALNNYEHFRQLRSFCEPRQQVLLDTLIQRMAKRSGRRR